MKNWPWYAHLVLAVLIFGLFFMFYYRPKDNDLKRIIAERERVEARVEELKRKEIELAKIELQLETMEGQFTELEKIIPNEQEIDVILRRIQQLAYDSRINLIKFVPGAWINQEFVSEKPIAIEVNGNYHNLAMFFNEIGNFERLFNVIRFDIKSTRAQTDTRTISATSTVKTYIFVEPPPPEEKKPAKKKRQ